MAFTWVNPTTQYGYATSEEISEIQAKMGTLSASIQNPAPSTTPITFFQSAVDDALMEDPVMDEIQINLNTLKSENYCRGHHSILCVAVNTADRNNVNYSRYGGYVTAANITQHSNKHFSDNSTDHGTYLFDHRNTNYVLYCSNNRSNYG